VKKYVCVCERERELECESNRWRSESERLCVERARVLVFMYQKLFESQNVY